MVRLWLAASLVIELCLSTAALSAEPRFSPRDVLDGRVSTPAECAGPGRIWVDVDGRGDCLRFYGAVPEGSAGSPVVYLDGDVVQRSDRSEAAKAVWDVPAFYTQLSPSMMQSEAEQYAAATHRGFINLARPGSYGSSGNHLERRRKREVDLVNAALDRLKERFGWSSITLAGTSGGGHLVAALLARRADIDCAVIAAGNVAVRKRLEELGLAVDTTGFADFVDPIDLVGDVARHPPRSIIMLTDPMDTVVTASSQDAYLAALRGAGVAVEKRFVVARDPSRHLLRMPAILAALACR